MINEYIVKYYMGTKKNSVYQLHVCAHDEDEAKKIVVAQAWNRHGGHAKVNVLEAEDENKPDYILPELTPEPVKPQPKKPFNWNGCVSTSVFALCAYIVITALVCCTPCWLIYALIKYLGG